MSQRAVEVLLGKLITDREFRQRFFEDPATMCFQQPLDLTTGELEAVLRIEQGRIEAFAKRLDTRIVRAAGISGAHYWGTWAATPTAVRERGRMMPPAGRLRSARKTK